MIHKKFQGLPLTMVLDNAAYHRNTFVREKAAALGTTLFFLPPYSPNLNLIERFGTFVKAECLRSHYYKKFPEFCDAISTCLANTSTEHQSRLDTLLTLKLHRFKSVA